MRARYLIPAAALVAAAYLKGRHDRLAGFPPPLARVPVPPAPEQAPAVPELVLAEAEVAAGAEPSAQEAPVPEPDAQPDAEPDATGRFSLEGWAAMAGQMTVRGITFPDRLGRRVAAGDVRLVVDARTNVADGGLVVLGDAGFAPDDEGFTLLLAAAAPGGFAASGRYEVR